MSARTVGTAGHIDHGKTSLVEALTGRNTDRLAEERRRGISIELGYAELDLGGERVSVVDVPGHERFVRTMVAGASGIDVALLCVACDDGVMPQTREHLAILELLGVRAGVVALTKRDLVDDEGVELAQLDVEEALAGSGLERAVIVPVSVRSGLGLDALRDALRAVVAASAGTVRGNAGRTRLPIDRTFTLRGIGTVVTGTLWSGALSTGDEVRIEPSGREARIRSLQVHDSDTATATAGGRVAVCLVGVERNDVPRGSTLVAGPALPRSYRLDVVATALPGGPGIGSVELEVLHGAAQVRARALPLDGERIAPGEQGLLQLRLVAPLATLRGDPVVLRSLAPPATIAGARVVDPAPRRHAGSEADRARIALLRTGDPRSILLAAAGSMPTRAADVAGRGLLDPREADEAARALVAEGAITALDDGWLLREEDYRVRREEVAALLAARAAAHPLEPAVAPRRALGDGPWHDALVMRLERDGVLERDGAGVVAPGARAGSEAEGEAAAALLAALAVEPFRPPRLDEILPGLPLAPAAARALVAVLEREGRVVRLPDGLAVTSDAYQAARAIVADGCAAHGSFTLAQLRDATGTSRRFAQALLERMDADGLTRRVGDARILRRART